MIRLAACVLVAALAPACAAADRPARERTLREPLDGVVLDQTVSAAGHEFYRQFCTFWHDKPLSGQFALAVREHPSARRGSQVVVEYAGRCCSRGPARAGRPAPDEI